MHLAFGIHGGGTLQLYPFRFGKGLKYTLHIYMHTNT
jgi:hypothetical protein